MKTNSTGAIAFLTVAALLLIGCSPDNPPPSLPEASKSPDVQKEGDGRIGRCADFDPLRQVYFGDLHVHTALSQDAFVFDVRTSPADAYRFAKGGPIALPPLDDKGQGTRIVQLERPLDFAAVTDHAEYLGAVSACTRADSPAYHLKSCRDYRGEDGGPRAGVPNGFGMDRLMERFGGRTGRLFEPAVCGADGANCERGLSIAWEETKRAARDSTDGTPSCGFSALLGYEYSYTPDLTKIHRNVIFRGLDAPFPISSRDEPNVYDLWRRLTAECIDSDLDCDALTIPHNSNLSNGRIFALNYEVGEPGAQIDAARLRSALEPLMEVMQIKGSMECRNDMWNVLGGSDELCDFEMFSDVFRVDPGLPPDCEGGTGQGALVGKGCSSRLDYMRYALIEGLREADRIGVNPIQVGAIGSTDTHDGTPGAVEENLFDGVTGRWLNDFRFNPGGLAAVWAEENTRASLFDAMKRRETYATSGPRMQVRFFGGWGFSPGLCQDPEWVKRAYAEGVPMGGEISGGADTAPSFVVSALRDPGTSSRSGGLLERIQIVKGWVGPDGRFNQALYDVAGDASGSATVDLETCTPLGPGADALCTVWRDPDFNPSRRAVYYARVLENPSCRYTTQVCLNSPAHAQPEVCRDDRISKTIQERAWTSPIWYSPTS